MGLNEVALMLLICGFIVGLNPSVISVLISLLASLFGEGNSKSRVAIIAFAYLETTFVLYLGFALFATVAVNELNNSGFEYFGLFIGLALVACGIYEIIAAHLNSHNNHRRHLSAALHKHTVKHISAASVITAALLTAIRNFGSTLLPVIGASYILAFLYSPQLGFVAILPIAALLPMAILSVVAVNKIKISALMKWKNDNAVTFKTWAGAVLVILGWVIWLLINGSLVIT